MVAAWVGLGAVTVAGAVGPTRSCWSSWRRGPFKAGALSRARRQRQWRLPRPRGASYRQSGGGRPRAPIGRHRPLSRTPIGQREREAPPRLCSPRPFTGPALPPSRVLKVGALRAALYARRPKPGIPLASDSEDDDELPWGPALGDTASPRVVPESDPEEPDVHPDVRPPRKRYHTPAPGRHPDVATPCPDPDVRGPKKRRFGPQTTPDPGAGRKIAVPNVQPPNHSLNPQKVVNPDVKHLAGSNQTLNVESDADVKVPPQTALFHPNRHRTALEVCSNLDVEERGPNPDVGGTKNRCRMVVVDSDTDVEEVEVLPDVGCPKIRRRDPNMPQKTGVEMETPHPDVGGPKNGCQTLVDSDTDVEMESSNSAVEGPTNRHQMLVVDSDTDVEENGTTPDVGCPQTHQETQNVSKNQNSEMGTLNADVEHSQNGHQLLLVDSDTDVEENGANPDVGYPKTHQTTQNIPSKKIIEVEIQRADVKDSQKGHQMLVVDSDTDVEEDTANPDVGCPESPRRAPRGPGVKTETTIRDVEGERTLLVESDTDAEEDISNPDVGTRKTHGATQNVPRIPVVETERPDPRQKKQWTLVVDSDTDVEENEGNADVGCKKIHRIAKKSCKDPDVEAQNPNPGVRNPPNERWNLEMDSDTDVEEEDLSQHVLRPNSHKTPQNTRKDPTVVMETPNPDVGGLSWCSMASNGDSDTDVEENEGNADVGCKKIHRIAKKSCKDPDVEAQNPNPGVGNPPNERRNLEMDSDTDVEEEDLSQRVLRPNSHKTPQNTRKDPTVVMETPNPDVGGLSWCSVASNGDSDTDVEDLDALPNVGAPNPCGTAHEGMDTVTKVATAPDVDPEGPMRTNDDPELKLTFPAPDVGAPKAQGLILGVDSDRDVEDNVVIPDVETVQRCQRASGDPDVAMTPPNPDVSSPTSPQSSSDTDVEEVAPTPDVRSLRSQVRFKNCPHPDVATGSDATVEEMNPKCWKSSPKRQGFPLKSEGDTSVERMVPNHHDLAPTMDVEAPNPDVGPQQCSREPPVRGRDPAVPPDVSTPESPHVDPNSAVTGDADGAPRSDGATPSRDAAAAVTESDTEGPSHPTEDLDLFLEPTQSFLTPAAKGTAPDWDTEEPTQRFFLPKEDEEEEEQPPQDPPDAWVRPPDSWVPPRRLGPQRGSPAEAAPGWDPEEPTQRFFLPREEEEKKEEEQPPPEPTGSPPNTWVPPRCLGPQRGSPAEAAPGWDPEEPTQRFFLPREDEEEEEQPPQDPPDAWVPPAEPVTVTPAQEGAGTRTAPSGEVGEGPRRSQRLARSRGGGAKGGGGGASRVRGGEHPDPAPVRRSPRLQAPPPAPEPLTTRGRGQMEPRPPTKPRPRRTGPAPPQTQEEEEEPPEVTGHQLRPRGGPASAPPKVLFTGVVASPDMEVALKTLGGSMATSVFDCTHLVTDRVRRTVKFLCAVARGVPIVTPEWLHKSARSGRVLVPGPFLVRDSQQESHFGFSLAQALRRARRRPLLQGYEVHVTPSVRPEPEHMRDIVTCSGGTFLPTMPHTYAPRRLVISCEADAGRWAPALAARLPLASAELLLTGLLRQRLHLPPFLLTPPAPPRDPPHTPGRAQEHPPRDPPGTRRRPAAPPTR
ncbi:mediator of DNA damage checkpoint protein 1 [Numenius arquata]|uniref:mediator of DNA damage checkpoint protein 1 n=1 Tax=Numenius arquata TaxID=31919 RepID=UPI003D30A747